MITAMPRIAIAVRDFDAATRTFEEQFGLPVIDISDTSVDSLGAKLAMCVPSGGSNIELMSPADPDAPLAQSLDRFLDRRGEGLFALMLEAPDPDEEADRLIDRGLDVLPLMAGAAGRDIHPRSTHGVLIRIYPDNSFEGQKERDDAAGLSGIARVVIAVRDIDAALAVYGDSLGLESGVPVTDAERGVTACICRPPKGGVIELVSVDDESRPFAQSILDFLNTRGEGMFAVVLQAGDVGSAMSVLSDRELAVSRTDDDGIEADMNATFGARIRIESQVRSIS